MSEPDTITLPRHLRSFLSGWPVLADYLDAVLAEPTRVQCAHDMQAVSAQVLIDRLPQHMQDLSDWVERSTGFINGMLSAALADAQSDDIHMHAMGARFAQQTEKLVELRRSVLVQVYAPAAAEGALLLAAAHARVLAQIRDLVRNVLDTLDDAARALHEGRREGTELALDFCLRPSVDAEMAAMLSWARRCAGSVSADERGDAENDVTVGAPKPSTSNRGYVLFAWLLGLTLLVLLWH